MRILLAVLSTSALATAAIAQQQPSVTPPVAPQGTIQAKAAIAECDRLISYLEQTRPADAGVTVEQAGAWRQANNFEACRETLLRVSEAKPDSFSTQSNQVGTPGSASGPTGLPTVTSSGLPASPPAPAQGPATGPAPAGPNAPPQARAAPPSGPGAANPPQVVVQQAQPSVTVTQKQPEIIVRMPPPTITVHQPNPEIVVRMPPPDVNVSVARPEVQVSVPQPVVQVVPPQAQAQPQVRTEEPQPNVRLERTGEPRIVYQPAEGPPQVRFETAAGETAAQTAGAAPSGAPGPVSQTGAQAQLNSGQAGAGSAGTPAGGSAAPARPAGEPAQTGALPGEMRALKVSQLEDMGVYNGRGEKLGDVEKMLMGADNKPYFLVSHGGFLGLGSKQVAISSDQLALRGDRLVADALTDEQVRGFPEFKESANFKEMDDDQTTSVRAAQ
jgi:PRC-barrel domain